VTEQTEPRYRVTVTRTAPGTFVARNRDGDEIRFSTGDEGGFSLVELMLAAIAGCSSIDVDTLVTRRAEPTSFVATVTGERERDEKGASYADQLIVSFALELPPDEAGDEARRILPEAVRLSHDRLCTVANTIQRGTPIEMTVA